LLLGEGDERTFVNSSNTLHGTSGGERPARSALTLILDTSDLTLGSPVD
jgi:hypothetical protein